MATNAWHAYSKNQPMDQEVWEFNGEKVNVRPAKVRMAKVVFRNPDGSLDLPKCMRCSPGVYYPPEVMQEKQARARELRKDIDERTKEIRRQKRKEWNKQARLRRLVEKKNPYVSDKRNIILDEDRKQRLLQSLNDKNVTKETIARRKKKIQEKYPHLLYK